MNSFHNLLFISKLTGRVKFTNHERTKSLRGFAVMFGFVGRGFGS